MAERDPKHLEAVDKLAQLRRARTEPLVVTWPRTNLQVALIRLEDSKIQECYAATYARLKKVPLEDGTFGELPLDDKRVDEVLASELSIQILYRACVDHEDLVAASRSGRRPRPFFASAEELRDEVEADRRRDLFAIYSDWCEGTEIASLPEGLREEIFELVKKKDARSLRALGSSTLAIFTLLSASPPSSSTT